MNFRRYQNELIAGISLMIMLGAFLFKQGQISGEEERMKTLQSSVSEMKEVVALKEIWDNTNLNKKVKELQTSVPPAKVKWQENNKKVIASYQGLSVDEFNNLMKKLLNLGVEIQLFDVKKQSALYDVELRCKW
ncbi:hypothetical protein PGH07_10585 [Sulfurovum sp. zt1-1]|uniref:Uncharacterized protein n=1 Tax=Sulfurovum zhangzhouensis TaxID=3019067 RepID=A0ABT7R0S0_9BACT|nr:hypothetical protein [Sulfurovum zhangzhouensis]MDM5272617.1 hypothetical protein [Sulfurovum zhangzhouensis]